MISVLIGSIVLTRLSQDTLDRSGSSSNAALPDLFHNILPDLSAYEQLIDLIPASLGLLVIIFCRKNITLRLRKIATQLSIVYLLRVITSSVTVLPSPICTTSRPSCKAIGGCHDLIFSGHTSTMLIFAWHLQRCFPEYRTHLILFCILGSAVIVATRGHYTIDVIVAWIVVHSVLAIT